MTTDVISKNIKLDSLGYIRLG